MKPKFNSPRELEQKINDFQKYIKVNNYHYTMERLCWFIGISRRTLLNIMYSNNLDNICQYYSWSKQDKQEIIDLLQEQYDYCNSEIIELSMKRDSATGCIFNLKNNWNYADKLTIESTNINENTTYTELSVADKQALRERALEVLQDSE